jgi:hypothetical protein
MGLWERLHKQDEVEGDGVHAAGPSVGDAIAMARADRKPEVWGRPGRCPQCGGIGYLDRVDIVDRLQYEHCTACFHKWSVSERDTVKAF